MVGKRRTAERDFEKSWESGVQKHGSTARKPILRLHTHSANRASGSLHPQNKRVGECGAGSNLGTCIGRYMILHFVTGAAKVATAA